MVWNFQVFQVFTSWKREIVNSKKKIREIVTWYKSICQCSSGFDNWHQLLSEREKYNQSSKKTEEIQSLIYSTCPLIGLQWIDITFARIEFWSVLTKRIQIEISTSCALRMSELAGLWYWQEPPSCGCLSQRPTTTPSCCLSQRPQTPNRGSLQLCTPVPIFPCGFLLSTWVTCSNFPCPGALLCSGRTVHQVSYSSSVDWRNCSHWDLSSCNT